MNRLTLIIGFIVALSSVVFAQEATPVPATDTTATPAATAETTSTGAAFLDANYVREAKRYDRDSMTFVNSEVYFKLDSMDADTGLDRIEYGVDGGIFQNYLNPFNLLQEGYHLIRYRGIDNGDNVEITKVLQVYVDNIPPTSKVESDRALYTFEGTTFSSARTKFYIGAVDNESGAGVMSTYASTQLGSLEGRGNGSRSAANFFSIEEEGPLSLYYTAMDNVGNLARIRQFNVTVDATAPVVSIQSNNNLRLRNGVYTLIPSEELKTDDGKLIITAQNRIGFTAKDNLSGVRAIYVKVNEEDFVQYFEEIEVKGSDEYTIQVRAEDNVGNISDPVTFVFKVDSMPPASEIQMIRQDGAAVDQQ